VNRCSKHRSSRERTLARRNHDWRFPDRMRAVDLCKDTWREISGIRISEYQDFWSRETLAKQNRDSRFLDTVGTVRSEGHVSEDPKESGIGELKVPCTLTTGIAVFRYVISLQG
jgi:hypothetical protein